MGLLEEYKQHQAEYAESIGDQWTDTDRLFTKWDGTPMHPNNPLKFFILVDITFPLIAK
jgi:hypothetical protein